MSHCMVRPADLGRNTTGRRPQALRGVGKVIARAALVVAAMGASPAVAETEYLGGGYITVGDGCAQFGWTGTHQVMVRMAPQGMPGNPATETQMSLLMNTGTIAVRLNLDHGFRYTYTPTQAVYIWNGPYSPAAPTMTFSFNPDSNWPPSGGYLIERLNAQIHNFNEHAGCTAMLFASLAQTQ